MHAILALLLALQAQDETLEKARKLLEESAAKLRSAPAVGFQIDQYSGEAGSDQARVPFRSTGVLQAPNKLRWEWKSGSTEHLQIYDGANIWSHDSGRGEWYRYRQFRASLRSRALDNPLILLSLEGDSMKLLDRAKDVVVAEKKEEGGTFNVISWRGRNPYGENNFAEYSLWIDAARLPRRFSRSLEFRGRLEVRSLEFTIIDLAPKVDPATFAFKPPEGSKERANPPFQPEIPEAAKTLLLDIHKEFRGLEAISYDVEMTSESDGETGSPVKHRTTLMRGDRIRQETQSEHGESLVLVDGDSMWRVMPSTQNYTCQDLMIEGHRMIGGGDLFMAVFFVSEGPTIDGAQEIGVTTDTLDGETCDVIEWFNQQPNYKIKHRFWVGSDRRPRLKTMDSDHNGKKYRTRMTYKSFDMKPVIPKDHFTFKAPPGWTDRTGERFGESLIAAGKPAPDFEAVAPGGEGFKLASLRGSPVVLVFGYFSHPSEAVRVQEFHDEFSKRGVKVVAVCQGAAFPKIDPKKYSFQIVRLKDKATEKAYGVDYYSGGLYLLDGDGKILISTYANEALKKAVADSIPEAK